MLLFDMLCLTHKIQDRLQLRAHCEKICLNPAGYRRRPDLSDNLRSCAHGSYVIFFESTTEQVTIVRILHGARDVFEVLNPP